MTGCSSRLNLSSSNPRQPPCSMSGNCIKCWHRIIKQLSLLFCCASPIKAVATAEIHELNSPNQATYRCIMTPMELHPQAGQIPGGCDPLIPQLCNWHLDQILSKLLFLQMSRIIEHLSVQQTWEATCNDSKRRRKTCSGQIRKSFDTIPVCFNTANLVNSAQVQDTKLDDINIRVYRILQKTKS